MLTIMLSTRRSLLIHLRHHGFNFAEFAAVFGWASTSVFVDTIDTSASVLTHIVNTIVDVISTIDASKSGHTLASVMSKVINTLAAILTGAELGSGTKGNFALAEFARKSTGTVAFIGSDFIDTGGIVLTSVTDTIIGIDFASCPFKAQGTNTSIMRIHCIICILSNQIGSYENRPASTTWHWALLAQGLP